MFWIVIYWKKMLMKKNVIFIIMYKYKCYEHIGATNRKRLPSRKDPNFLE